jgi:hypothetical protein
MTHPLLRAAVLAAALAGAAAQAQDKDVLRAEVAKPLQAAQDAIKAGKSADALARIREAEAVPGRTPYEVFITDRMKGSAALQAGEPVLAQQAFEAAVTSGRLAGPDLLAALQALSSLAVRNNQPQAAVTWARRYFAEGGTEPKVRVALVQALYASGDLAATAREVLPLISADEAAGRSPNEEQLKLLGFSQMKTGDEAGYTQTLERLVTHHPRTEYWADLVSRVSHRAGFADRLQVDALRLARRVGALEDASEYLDLAQLALQAGVPGEAQAVVDDGYAKGVLGKGPQAERHQRLKAGADKASADDRSALAASEDSARKTRDGAALVAMGQALQSYGQADKGLALMAEGLAKGALKHPDDARLRYGVALLAAGQRAAAEAQFKTITATDGAADLARLWLLVR